MTNQKIKDRLEYLRNEVKNASISYSEIAELQGLAKYIDKGDVELLEWAGVPEFKREMKKYKVIDQQGASFMDDTHKNPMTANALRSRFWSLNECRTENYKDFTLNFICETWLIDLEEVK
jgi:hypothetical protein